MRLQFILSEMGIGLRRNLAITVSVILVSFVSLTFVGAGALMQQQISVMKDDWYDRVQVSIFMCGQDSTVPSCAGGEVTQAQKDQIVADLESDLLGAYVAEWFYESKAEAYQRFQEQFDDSAILDNVTQDQMPESYRVQLVNPEEYSVVSEVFTGREGVEEVQDQRRLLDSFFQVLNAITAIALAIAAAMLVCSILLVVTTIRLSAFNRRRETGIMRLVGASNVFIQLPFILEGAIAAIIGAALASGALFAIVHFGVGWLSANVPLTPFVGADDVLLVSIGLFVLGIVIAGLSSALTLGRYLKV